MNRFLPPPDEDLARKILGRVAYKDRIPAGRLTPHLGIMRGSVRGMTELHLFLTPDGRTLPAINLDRLADWIERVINDDKLALEIRMAIKTAGSYVDGCLAIYEMTGHRLSQAKVALGIDSVGAATRGD